MEEGGHYYTVYITSLAVGFSNSIAQQLATLAQMPDQIGAIDAYTLHVNRCVRGLPFTAIVDLTGQKRKVSDDWRYLAESVLHSLVDRSANNDSGFQRRITRAMLIGTNPVSLQFGLALHRIGDTFAHTDMHNVPMMYTSSRSSEYWGVCSVSEAGHGRDGHAPDYPFVRQQLFREYVTELYDILLTKAREANSACHLTQLGRMSLPQLLSKFAEVFRNLPTTHLVPVRDNYRTVRYTDDQKHPFFLNALVALAQREFNVNITYRPEQHEIQTFDEFLADHPELREVLIDGPTILRTLQGMDEQLNSNNQVPLRPAT